MARRDDILGVTGAETVIGAGVIARGSVTSEGDVTIDGTLDGQIKAGGNLIIGVNGSIKGNVSGENVMVGGSLEGNITATGEASVGETGRVIGDIDCSSLTIASGAIVQGQIRMHESHPPTESESDDAPDTTED